MKRPRHFLLVRMAADGYLEIGRVLHDSMDLERNLQAERRRVGDDEHGSAWEQFAERSPVRFKVVKRVVHVSALLTELCMAIWLG